MLDSRFSGGAGAGEKATFSLTYGEARREDLVYVYLRKVVSAPLGPSLDAYRCAQTVQTQASEWGMYADG